MKKCTKCGEVEKIIKNGKSGENQKYKCKVCGTNFIDQEVNKIEDQEIPVDGTVDTGVIAESVESVEKTENEKTIKERSNIIKNKNFRENYNNNFDIPKHSKKYGFSFSSWKEYFLKKHESKKNIKINQTTIGMQ
ncbi:MAG: hypothetical protein PHN31_01710 [Candidatus Gracilibacteria bacterium]|nr:hypothetical protein [Candidatus Gracilibacteria bacterium]